MAEVIKSLPVKGLVVVIVWREADPDKGVSTMTTAGRLPLPDCVVTVVGAFTKPVPV